MRAQTSYMILYFLQFLIIAYIIKKVKINSSIVQHRTPALKTVLMSKMILSYLFSIDHFIFTIPKCGQ
jgi:hypothetical protein